MVFNKLCALDESSLSIERVKTVLWSSQTYPNVCMKITYCTFYHYHTDQAMMYEEIASKCPNVQKELVKDNRNAPFYLLWKKVPSCSDEELLCFWRISGCAITRMYRKAKSNKTGVG